MLIKYNNDLEDLSTDVSGKANIYHTHTVSDISGLSNGDTVLVRSFSFTVAVPGNESKEGYGSFSGSVAYSGYTPLGVVGYSCPSAWHHLYAYIISGTTLSYSVRCTGLQTVTAPFTFYILYKKN